MRNLQDSRASIENRSTKTDPVDDGGVFSLTTTGGVPRDPLDASLPVWTTSVVHRASVLSSHGIGSTGESNSAVSSCAAAGLATGSSSSSSWPLDDSADSSPSLAVAMVP